ncbi:glutathione S-transferase family protein [Ramlibacter albus]|uniref:Glutathione S-transferase family protein n=1 Tax=Ramlibacter albus TaxID=2079448 RepID=A0A923S2B6_9BURK|nr:glutathione S-transferase family protein [Ramlibacter albus]MBC5765200.1 glutathione S-transferase family protein [Ramlibacter albus]
MKLYYHPASTTCRPIMLLAAEAGIPLEMQLVDLFTGEQYKPHYEAVNPNHLVPVLQDGDFRLTESSAICKYLAEKSGSPLYPSGLQERARINEVMDWVNTQLNRDLCYGFVYPQIFGFHKRRSEEAQQAQLEWGKERAQGWLKVLDQHHLKAGNNYVCGDKISLADYFAAPFVHVAQLTGTDFAAYPNVQAWLGRMKALPSWGKVFETIEGYGATLKGQPMVTV